MGPSPASALAPPPCSSASPLNSAQSDWFLAAALDRDTQILAQALTHELSTPVPSASSSPCQTLVNGSESLHLLRALQQHKHKQQHPQQKQAAAAAMAAMPCGWRSQDAFHHVEHSSLQMGSPPSSNSHSPFSASNPGSPYSNVSTITSTNSSMSMPIDSLLAHMKSLHQDVQEGPFASGMISHNAPSAQAEPNSKCFHSSGAASMALSSQAAQGAGAHKVSKRRSRSNNRNPITVLSTDVSNFRAMVQQLTGIPSTASMPSYVNSSIWKHHPTKHPYTNTECLPTLDTSASFLEAKPAMQDPLEGFSFAQKNHHPLSGSLSGAGNAGCNVESMFRSGESLDAKQCVFGDQPIVSSSSSSLSSVWNYAVNANTWENSLESQHISTKRGSNAEEELLPSKSQFSPVDSWLSFDGVLANQAPNIEIARMA